MSLIMITEAMKLMEETDADFGMEDKEFIAQYAFRTGDTDLVKKLIEELQEKDADREKVKTKYMQLADKKPEWAEQIENLRIVNLLKESLKIPFLFLSSGESRILRCIGGSLGNCMTLCVHEYDELATKAQPLLSDVKAIRDLI